MLFSTPLMRLIGSAIANANTRQPTAMESTYHTAVMPIA